MTLKIILRSLSDLDREHRRRLQYCNVNCEKCDERIWLKEKIEPRILHKKLFFGGFYHKALDNHDIPEDWFTELMLPLGYLGTTCNCGLTFPEVNFEEVEFYPPCECKGCKGEPLIDGKSTYWEEKNR